MIRHVAMIEMSARIGALIVRAAADQGVDPAVLEKATGFSAQSAMDPDARITITTEQALWEEAAARSHDDAFGLHAAEHIAAGAFDLLDYVVRTAPTVRAALERLVRYNRLEHDAAVFTLLARRGYTRVEHEFRFGGAVQCRHSAEFTLAAQVVFARQLAGTALFPRAVEFRHTRPPRVREHARIFGVAPTFDAKVNAVEWDDDVLAHRVPSADPALSRIVERHADAVLAARPEAPPTYAERVRQVLTARLGEEEPSLSRVAKHLKMSERSIQRRLAADGASFDSLLDHLRHELALKYLADPKLAIGEVAYLLGYSEASPFYRAFRRWTGTTPAELRRRCA